MMRDSLNDGGREYIVKGLHGCKLGKIDVGIEVRCCWGRWNTLGVVALLITLTTRIVLGHACKFQSVLE